MQTFQGVSAEQTAAFRKAYESDPLSRAMTNALYKTSVNDASFHAASKPVSMTRRFTRRPLHNRSLRFPSI